MIPRLGLQPVTRIRRTPGGFTGPLPKAPTTASLAGVQVSIQGVPDRVRRALPEGLLSADAVYLVSRTEFRTDSTENGVISDLVVLANGATYDVVHVTESPPFLIETRSWACTANRVQDYQPPQAAP